MTGGLDPGLGAAQDLAGPVDLVVEAPGWLEQVPDLAAAAGLAARLALGARGLDPSGYEIALLACDDARIAALNGAFRGRARPTNVLSWPALRLTPAAPGALPPLPPAPPPGGRIALGDVAIALETARAEAAAASLPLKNHAIHMILHACLHLLGFDHETEADAELMEGIESRSLIHSGLHDPYV